MLTTLLSSWRNWIHASPVPKRWVIWLSQGLERDRAGVLCLVCRISQLGIPQTLPGWDVLQGIDLCLWRVPVPLWLAPKGGAGRQLLGWLPLACGLLCCSASNGSCWEGSASALKK